MFSLKSSDLVRKILVINVFEAVTSCVCTSPGRYHSASKTQKKERILQLSTIHCSANFLYFYAPHIFTTFEIFLSSHFVESTKSLQN